MTSLTTFERLGFPADIPMGEGQLSRCVLRNRAPQFWPLRNASIAGEPKLGAVRDILISHEIKLLQLVRHILELRIFMNTEAGSLYVSGAFQSLLFECAALLDTTAWLYNAAYDLRLSGPKVSFRHRDYEKAAKAKCGFLLDVLARSNGEDAMDLLKLFRDAYIHRAAPNQVTRTSSDPKIEPVFLLRLLGSEREELHKLAKRPGLSSLKDVIEHDVAGGRGTGNTAAVQGGIEDQVGLLLWRLAVLCFESTIALNEVLLARFADEQRIEATQHDDPARLGHYEGRTRDIGRTFDGLLALR